LLRPPGQTVDLSAAYLSNPRIPLILANPDPVMPALCYTSKGAVISACGLYRYILRRCWDETLPPYIAGMLNPSTADADEDDPTITRVVRRAAGLGFGSLVVWNLYAYRACDPAQLSLVADPVGPDNRNWIHKALKECADRSGIAMVGWGSGGTSEKLAADVRSIAAELGVKLHCLGVTKEGHPRHPLYVSYSTVLQPWGSLVLPGGGGAV
jgi:hypothetical protein